jgi:hypothetical protein
MQMMDAESNQAAGDSHAVLLLRGRIGTLERTLAQRERALSELNRRLLMLETGEGGNLSYEELLEEARVRALLQERVTELEASLALRLEEIHHCHAEIARQLGENERLRATKLFRYSAPARRVYGLFRRTP